ncbi:MAG: efflux RND transporter periplasmic adaptor subunit, partial [Alphaproteobacteria bacterium]
GGEEVIIKMTERELRAAGIVTQTVEPERGATELTFPGNVVVPPQQLRVVAAPAAGLVEAMAVAVDEPVVAGQLLAHLRSPDIVEAQRQYIAALADDTLATDRLRRTEQLYSGRAIAERDLRIAQAEAANAASRLDERTQLLRLLGLSDQELTELKQSRRITSSIAVYAPIAGTILSRQASPGERVAAAAPLFTLAELDPVWINLQVPAARLGTLTTGSAVFLPAQRANGRIIRIGRSVEPQTQSVTAVAEVESAGGTVRPGLAVTVNVRVAQSGMGQWTVPGASVVRHRDRAWVFIRSGDGFRARPVQVVAESPRGASIRTELAATDQVAVRGILALVAELAETDRD